MTEIQTMLDGAVRSGASDIFIVAGFPVAFKQNGRISPQGEERILPDRSEALITKLYQLAGRDMERFLRRCV